MQDPAASPSTETPDSLPEPTWRRPLFVTMGLAMLGLGVYMNADALGLESKGEDEGYATYYSIGDEAPEEEAPMEEAGGQGQRHKGEEGKMGKPSAKAKTGLYAMKGPNNAVPQMAQNFDPNMAAQNAGILGVMQQNSGQFLASPYGGAYSVGNDDEDVWGGLTGSEVGEAYGVGGLGLVGTGRGGGGTGEGTIGLGNTALIGHGGMGDRGRGYGRQVGGERYAKAELNPFIATAKDAKSTFSIDVDTASYANVRRFLLESRMLPPPEAVRTEELVNYFNYDYAVPSSKSAPFSVTAEVGPSVWNEGHRLVHIGIQGAIPPTPEVPPRNLVFLVDVSGSMQMPDKLPLVKYGLRRLVENLDGNDRVSIVVYAGAAGAVLEPTAGDQVDAIIAALSRLESGGGTNGAAGIHLAYELAERAFIPEGINRVILASDGDFNVGISDHDALVELIEAKRRTGVSLSVLGYGTGNYNDRTMEQLADKGNGNYAYIDSRAEAQRVLVDQAGSMLQTIAKDVKIQVEFDPEQVAEHRLVGYENRVLAHRDFDDDTKDAGEIGAGHSVTAIYEVVPTDAAQATDAALMTLNLRYKQPKGSRSSKITSPVVDLGRSLDRSSTDYRFSAAVAAFAEALRGSHDELSYAEILALAEAALGEDADCTRHQFLELVHQAGLLSGEPMPTLDASCTRGETKPREVVDVQQLTVPSAAEPTEEPAIHIHTHESRPEWMTFTLEVLRLLPPLLALPLFVIAARSPRRRRRKQ